MKKVREYAQPLEKRVTKHIPVICSHAGGGRNEWHIQQDVIPLINGNCTFKTADGVRHRIDGRWDLIIAHPPCTRLCTTSQRWLYYGTQEYRLQKFKEQLHDAIFFMKFASADCDKIAIENPVGIMNTLYRKPDCIYNPYDFEGEAEAKKTCLWLKGLEPLKPTQVINKEDITHNIYEAKFNGKQYGWNDDEVTKLRSRTPYGVARAMAEQWG